MKTIGGEHSLFFPVGRNNLFGYTSTLKSSASLYRAGRDALAAILKNAQPQRIWLPNFVCESVWRTAVATASIEWYEVDCDLVIDISKFHSELRSGDLVILINILGSSIAPLAAALRNSPAILVAYITYGLLDSEEIKSCLSNVDYMMASLRKRLLNLPGTKLLNNLFHLSPYFPIHF